MKARTPINRHLSARRLPSRFSLTASLKREKLLNQRLLVETRSNCRKDEQLRAMAAEVERVESLVRAATQPLLDRARYSIYPGGFAKMSRADVMKTVSFDGVLELAIGVDLRGVQTHERGNPDKFIELLATRFARDVYNHAKKTLRLVTY